MAGRKKKVSHAQALRNWWLWRSTFMPPNKKGEPQKWEELTETRRDELRAMSWAQLARAERRALGDYTGFARGMSGTLARSIKTRGH